MSKGLDDVNDEALKKQLLKLLVESDLKNQLENTDEQDILSKNKDTYKKILEIYPIYKKEADFKSGDCIKWKKNLKNAKVPDYDEPILFIKYIQPVKVNESNPNQSNFMAECDMLCGVIVNNQFTTFGFDSSRFTWFQLSDLDSD